MAGKRAAAVVVSHVQKLFVGTLVKTWFEVSCDGKRCLLCIDRRDQVGHVCRMLAPRVALCLSFVLLLRLARLPAPNNSSVLLSVWRLPALLLDQHQEILSRYSSQDPDIAFVIALTLRDTSVVDWPQLSDCFFPLYRRWILLTRDPNFPCGLWACAVVLFGRILRSQVSPVSPESFYAAFSPRPASSELAMSLPATSAPNASVPESTSTLPDVPVVAPVTPPAARARSPRSEESMDVDDVSSHY